MRQEQECFKKIWRSRSLIDQKRSILLPITLEHPVTGTAYIKKKSNQWEEYLSDSDDHGNSFYGTVDEDDQEAQKYVFEVPKPKRKKSDRNASDDLLILLAHLQKEEKFHTSLIVEIIMVLILT